MRSLRFSLADGITALRIAASFGMIFFPPGSVSFLALYCLAGISDMADGPVARRLGASPYGAKLDSVADLIMAAVCILKLAPTLSLPVGLWIIVLMIGVLRVGNLFLSRIRHHRWIFLHTRANRLTGLLLFGFPLCPKTAFALIIASVAMLASLQETYFLWKGVEKT